MRTFNLFRQNPPSGHKERGSALAPGEIQVEGVEFSDGSVVLRWQTFEHSTEIFPSFETFFAVHGHPEYGTRIEWAEATPSASRPFPEQLRKGVIPPVLPTSGGGASVTRAIAQPRRSDSIWCLLSRDRRY
jgi:hypothetical protein